MAPAPRADRVRNDELILQAAARLLARDRHASVQAIADAAGVVRRTVYRRYPTREALTSAMATAAVADAIAAVEAFPGWDGGPGALRALVSALVGFGRRYPIAVLEHDPDPGSPVDARIVAILAAGARAGVLRADLDPRLINGVLLGAVATAVRLHPDGDPDRLADAITALLLGGISGLGPADPGY